MNRFAMDSFNRDGMMYCCNNDTVTIDFENYVRKDEFEDLINKVNELYNVKVADKDYAGDAFRLLSRRLSEGNKKKNENSFLNYEKEVVGYELLYDAK